MHGYTSGQQWDTSSQNSAFLQIFNTFIGIQIIILQQLVLIVMLK